MTRIEHWLVVSTPMAAIAVVALGLRLGAPEGVRAAIVYGAPASGAGTGLAWQVATFREEGGQRETIAMEDVEVVAWRAGREARWHGSTDDEGVAETLLALDGADGVTMQVRAGTREVLARGEAIAAPPASDRPHAPPWSRFARREGTIVLDVAVLGQRAASGFPATIWVRATDSVMHAPVAGATIEPQADASFAPLHPASRTDSRGWAEVIGTPMGYAVPLTLRAHSATRGSGEWDGALWISPGASQIVMGPRYAPDQEADIEVVAPSSARTTAYLEIDDARGRAWAAAIAFAATTGAAPRATVRAPKLAPGQYWAIAADSRSGASELGPGTIVRPFFVAESDAQALSFGADATECAPPRDSSDATRTVAVCLALASPTPLPRWTALDGFAQARANDARRRALGLATALAAIFTAMLLEGALLLRAALTAPTRIVQDTDRAEDAAPQRPYVRALGIAAALLVAVMGLALLAAFVLRVA